MKTVLSVTAALMLALSLGGQSNPANAADTKKPNIGPITVVPVTVNRDLAIGNVLAVSCPCTRWGMEQLDALYAKGITVEVFNLSNSKLSAVEARNVTFRVTYHDLVSGGVKTLETPLVNAAGLNGAGNPGNAGLPPGRTKLQLTLPGGHKYLAKLSVGITVSIHSPNDTNPSNNSITTSNICIPIVQ